MKDLGQEALDEMNRLLLNQQRLKIKLEQMGDNQIANLSKTIEHLQEQLKKLKQENTIHNNKAKKRRIHINNLKNENNQLREQLKEKNIKLNELRHQRNEANEVIKTTRQITGNIDLSQFDYEHRRKIDSITTETDSYLEKWGVK